MKYTLEKLGEVIEFLPKSKRRAGDALEEGKYPFFTSSYRQKFIDFADYKEEAIILGTGGSPTIHFSKNFSTSADTFVIKGKKEILDNKFFYYFLVSQVDLLEKGFKGAALKHISKEYIKNIEIPLPPLETQKKIVEKVDGLFAKIEEAKKLRKEAKESTENFLPSALHKIFEEGKSKWSEVKLGEVSEITRGGSPRPISRYFTENEDGINWIKIGDASNSNKYIYKTKQKIKKEGLKKSREVGKGDLLLSNSMSFGRPYIMKTTGAIHDGWLAIKPDHRKVSEEYLYQVLGSPQTINYVQDLAGGAVVKNLNIDRVKTIPVLLPPLKEQEKIVEHLDSLSEKSQQTQGFQSQTEEDLENLEKSILHKAFNDKLI